MALPGPDRPTTGSGVLEGIKPLVSGASADWAFVVAQDEVGLDGFLLDAPGGRSPCPSLDVTRKVARVVLDGRGGPGRVGPAGDHDGAVGPVLDDVNVALCAELGGTPERALELAVETGGCS